MASENKIVKGNRNSSTKTSPFLRWAGSKRKLLHKLSPYWKSHHERYIEPFMGSACFFFDLNPPASILSDINKDLIQTFISVRDNPKEVHESAVSILNSKENYYLVRKQNPESLSDIERAARFIFLNRFCFNGLYRTNLKGEFNVPYGSYGTGEIPKLEVFTNCSNRLKDSELINSDFELSVRENVKPGDFVYLDPPFATKNRRIFTQYDASSFGLSDLERLSNLLDYIVAQGADFVLSYGECDEVSDFFYKWNREIVQTQRNISGFSSFRRSDNEVIVSSIK